MPPRDASQWRDRRSQRPLRLFGNRDTVHRGRCLQRDKCVLRPLLRQQRNAKEMQRARMLRMSGEHIAGNAFRFGHLAALDRSHALAQRVLVYSEARVGDFGRRGLLEHLRWSWLALERVGADFGSITL